MSKFTTCWLAVAAEILEAEFGSPAELLPDSAMPDDVPKFRLIVDVAGDWGGSFTATVDQSALTALLAGNQAARGDGESSEPAGAEAVREQWQELFRRIAVIAAADLEATSGASCEVAMISSEDQPSGLAGMGYQLRIADSVVALVLADRVERDAPESLHTPPLSATNDVPGEPPRSDAGEEVAAESAEAIDAKGMELLLDVELEASLRFGSREMVLCDLLALGPGDVIQLDRALTDPVDLIIGDKIVARGEVVLVNGNFGLQIAEVAEPRKSLESIRCLF